MAEQLKNVAKGIDMPVLASWMGGAQVIAGEAILNQAEVPTFAYSDTAARMFAYLWRYSSNLQSLYETPPLNATLARRMMEGTNIHIALRGVRGRPPVDLNALEGLLVRFSHLVAEQNWVKEIDINPLFASPKRLIALDARVVVHDTETSEEKLPTLAIRPYPVQYVASRKLEDGTPVTIRPIRPEDEPLMVRFHGTLSDRSVYQRYLHPISLDARITHERLTRICFIDYDRELALVADHRDEHTKEHEILGVGRIIKAHGVNEAEFAILIADRFQRQGLGTMLLRTLVQVGRDEGLDRLIADILPDNHDMQRLCKQLGFHLYDNPEDGLVRAEIEL